MPLAIGLLMAIFGGLTFGFLFSPPGQFNLLGAIVSGLAFGLPTGLLFALLFPLVFRRKVSSLIDAIYAGNPKVAGPPPAEQEFSHRLVCNWMKSDNFAVGGVLYFSRERLVFVPHQQNLPQHREPIEIAPLSQVEFSIVEPRLNLLHRMFLQRPPCYLEVKWFGGNARFAVPEAERTLAKIKSLIATKQLEQGEPLTASFEKKDLTPLERVLREKP